MVEEGREKIVNAILNLACMLSFSRNTYKAIQDNLPLPCSLLFAFSSLLHSSAFAL